MRECDSLLGNEVGSSDKWNEISNTGEIFSQTGTSRCWRRMNWRTSSADQPPPWRIKSASRATIPRCCRPRGRPIHRHHRARTHHRHRRRQELAHPFSTRIVTTLVNTVWFKQHTKRKKRKEEKKKEVAEEKTRKGQGGKKKNRRGWLLFLDRIDVSTIVHAANSCFFLRRLRTPAFSLRWIS